MGFTVLLLLLLVTAGWWLRHRWSALRDAQTARREAELMIVFEARSKPPEKPILTSSAASDFYPTLPEQDGADARPVPATAIARARRIRAE